jgi:hypothetical protein
MTSCNKKEQFKNKNKTETFTNNNNIVNNAASFNNTNVYNNLNDFWESGGTAVIIAIVAVLIVCLGISILLTVLGHKARIKCVGNTKYGFYSPLIIVFLILMWLGNLVPPFTTAATLIGFIGTIIMIVLANDNCKK